MNPLPTRVLIAEDDANFGMMLKVFLEMNQFRVALRTDGAAAFEALRAESFDVGIFDVMMPHLDGFTLAERAAALRPDMPFVFLTARALKEDQVRGYRLGAVDYLVKPFDPEILLLKLRALLKNHAGTAAAEDSTFTIGSFTFDAPRRRLHLGDTTRKLSPKEAALLRLLCEKDGDVLPHSEALLKIWKSDDYFTKQSMNVFISKLRKYLRKDPDHRVAIENLHGKGFLLRVE